MRKKSRDTQPDRVWLFDLDNTLHDASFAIFNRIDSLMTQCIQELLQIEFAEADYLRTHYWQRYGATLIGLVKHHGINANDFLYRAHNFDPAPLLRFEPSLTSYLSCLAGRKIILTNAPANYARQILQLLDINHLFERVISIEDMLRLHRYSPKPSRRLMRLLLAELRLSARNCFFVDDTLRNLKAAHTLGIHTIHFAHPYTPFSSSSVTRPAYVDRRITSIKQLVKYYQQSL